MADPQGDGGVDLNHNPETISALHVKSVKEAAELANYLPLNWDVLPKLPFYGPFVGYNTQWYRASIAIAVLSARSRAQRVLTQDEMQALANVTARMTKRLTYEFPLLAGVVFALERRTRGVFGFPFYTPGPTFSPDHFPNKYRPLLTGSSARTMFHGLRFGAYTAATHFVLKMGFLVWASSLQLVEFGSDPKLAAVRESMKQNRDKYNELEKQARGELRENEFAGRHGPVLARKTAASGDENGEGTARDYMRISRETPQQQQQQWSQQQSQQQPQSQSYDDGYADSFAGSQDDFDDASPIAPSVRRQESSRPTGGPGASWERLRHPGAPGQKPVAISQAPQGQYGWEALRNGQAPPQQPKPAPSSSDSSQQTTGDYTISTADEEKAFAQNQAQKDFDAMLEKERKGESESSRRW
ncbi:hypothetical protein SBRCBS47491_005967 [Sporothrix bragantina]|uniref:Endo-1,3(4)-beta-glucanase n=1 Tax=Sporothrix bragantina TaxID=671064 RepID=A0ABP0C0Z7_9PEZI